MRVITIIIIGLVASIGLIALSSAAPPASEATPAFVSAVTDVVASPTAAASTIKTNTCGYDSSGSWANAICPIVWEGFGAQMFRIMLRCQQVGNPTAGVVTVYGPWRDVEFVRALPYTGSSASCPSSKPTRIQTTFSFSY